MKVAMVVRALPVHRLGGLEWHAHDLANALQKLGCEVTVVTSRHPEGLKEEVWPSGVRVRYLAEGPVGDYSLAFFRGVERLVADLDQREPFDIVHAQEFAGIFMQARPGRFVVTVHGTMTTETPLDRRYRRHLSWREQVRQAWRFRTRLALIPMFRKMLDRVDLVVTDSEFTAREVRRILGRRPPIQIVRLGVDFSRYQISSVSRLAIQHQAPLRIALLGRVQEMRGIPEALATAYRLRWHGIPFVMKIAGHCAEPEWLEGLISCFLLWNEVRYVGRLAPDAVSDFLADADVLLLPDRTQPAFGLVCVEAMLHGLPVVATRVGAVPEIVTEDVGWLISPWSVPEMTATLVRLARHPEEVREKAQRTIPYARQFTAERMARDMLAAYENVLSGAQARIRQSGPVVTNVRSGSHA
ncbi:MAG: glycosyltransferase family 4 protein [Candidatus Sumerlaea chitinivorans]|uniref:Glycosyl transferase, group 1 n=1 Tax=Sumerlaea chitinivorans TaxID=2250252 RepID=A0A2Z4Y6Z3_SUMC1|nr:Glycosyl transferase, group 1 [Candidatus Sumerlaea chitinivorans]MCX7963173.1 glycosyltransferase family 4 protein [Candidatus Sumerlaea chitinivorans]